MNNDFLYFPQLCSEFINIFQVTTEILKITQLFFQVPPSLPKLIPTIYDYCHSAGIIIYSGFFLEIFLITLILPSTNKQHQYCPVWKLFAYYPNQKNFFTLKVISPNITVRPYIFLSLFIEHPSQHKLGLEASDSLQIAQTLYLKLINSKFQPFYNLPSPCKSQLYLKTMKPLKCCFIPLMHRSKLIDISQCS